MKHLLLAVVAFLPLCLAGQTLQGLVTDEQGQPLPFADVYVEGTTRGTTTNAEGWYELPLEAGTWRIVFAYLGYQSASRQIRLEEGQTLRQDVALRPQAMDLGTVEVRAGENPAHAIIRRAMARRTYWLTQVRAFSCDAYVKGAVRIVQLPDQIMGMPVEPEAMGLDSGGRGYVYLSETVSRYHYQWPDRRREVIVSSKVSGDARGITFNSAADLDLNFYEPTIDFTRDIVSPIAPGAFGYYRYELTGAWPDEDGRLVYQIRLSPKNEELPAFHGEVHIVEGLWNLKYVDVWVGAAALNNPGVDTLALRQTYLPVADTVWRVFSQHIRVHASVLGIELEGDFLGIFRNYELEPDFPKGFFGNEIMRMEEEAPHRDSLYWEAIRPVPLARAERLDYRIKDSIAQIRQSRPWLDSLDRVNNRFSLFKLYTGYTHANTWKGRSWSIGSPLFNNGFDPVRGLYLSLPVQASWRLDADDDRRLELGLRPEYAFAERQFRWSATGKLRFDRKTRTTLELSAGHRVQQFNAREPVSWTLHELYALYDKRLLARVYDRRWAGAALSSRPLNGLEVGLRGELVREAPLSHSTEYCFCKKQDQPYPPNEVVLAGQWPELPPDAGEGAVVALQLRYRPGQRYISYPDFRIELPGKWPELRAGLVGGLPADWSSVARPALDFWRLQLEVERSGIEAGRWGELSVLLRWGRFLKRDYVSLPHFFHFDGTEIWFMRSGSYLQRFLALPYYRYSTLGPWASVAVEHNFRGALLDRLPLLRKLDLEAIASLRWLHTPDLPQYWEWGIGLGNLGFGVFRVFRFDAVWNKFPDRKPALHLRLGITAPLDQFGAGL